MTKVGCHIHTNMTAGVWSESLTNGRDATKDSKKGESKDRHASHS